MSLLDWNGQVILLSNNFYFVFRNIFLLWKCFPVCYWKRTGHLVQLGLHQNVWFNLTHGVSLAFWLKCVVTHRNAALDWSPRWSSLNADAVGSMEVWFFCGTENSTDIHRILAVSAILWILMQCPYSFLYRLLQLLRKHEDVSFPAGYFWQKAGELFKMCKALICSFHKEITCLEVLFGKSMQPEL